MKKKKFVFEGLGFPIILKEVPLTKVRGEEVPDIDYNTLQKVVLLHLSHKKSSLTGDELRFIRKYLELTTTAFGQILGKSSKEVTEWEKGEKPLEPALEVYLRLFVSDRLNPSDKSFRALFKSFELPFKPRDQEEPMTISSDELKK